MTLSKAVQMENKAARMEKDNQRAAMNNPVRRPAPEMSNMDTPVTELPTIDLSLSASNPMSVDRSDLDIITADRMPTDEDASMMAFLEEPVTIHIAKGSEAYAPTRIPIWINGDKGELFVEGQWIKAGFFPVNRNLITKRKYVEVLARSKVTSYRTEHDEAVSSGTDYVRNVAIPSTNRAVPFSLIGETSALGIEWYQRLMREPI